VHHDIGLFLFAMITADYKIKFIKCVLMHHSIDFVLFLNGFVLLAGVP
jgi:hypothetical protein